MKISKIIWIPLMLTVVHSYGQPMECERMYLEAKNLAESGRYENALNKLAASKICNSRELKYDSLIVEIYKEINRQKELAIAARKEAELALVREKEAKKLETSARREAETQKENVQRQLVANLWNNSRQSAGEGRYLISLLYNAEAAVLNKDPDLQKKLSIDISRYQPQVMLTDIITTPQPVLDAIFSPDGRYILSRSGGNSVNLWDTAGEQPAGKGFQHDDKINMAVFSPDSKLILTAGADATARIWEIGSGKQKGASMKGFREIRTARFSPDGKTILTIDFASVPVLWDTETGERIGRIMSHAETGVFSPDGRMILTIYDDSTARLWRAAVTQGSLDSSLATALADSNFKGWSAVKEQQVGSDMRHNGPVQSAVFGPDGNMILTVSSENLIRFWSNTGQRLSAIPEIYEPGIISASFSPDSKFVLTVNSDHTIKCREIKTGRQTGNIMKHEGDILSAVFSPDGKMILTSSRDRTARLWDIVSGQPLGTEMMHEGAVNSATFSPDGKKILTGGNEGVIKIWRPSFAGRTHPQLELLYAGVKAVYSPDGREILSTGIGNTGLVWNAHTGRLTKPPLKDETIIATTAGYSSVVYSPDMKKILAASSDNTVMLYDAASAKQSGIIIKQSGRISRAVYSPDGGTILTSGWDSTARLWDAVSGNPVGEPMRHDGYVFEAAFSPDGKLIITACRDGTARLWIAPTGRPAGIVFKHESDVISAGFSPDGKSVITGCSDLYARVWDVATGKQTGAAMKHNLDIFDASFSPDGKIIVTAGKDKIVRLWDAVTCKQLGPDLLHDDAVSSAVFSPDGKKILTADWTRSAYIWNLGADPDISPALFKLQARVLTGTEMNLNTNELQFITRSEWEKILPEWNAKGKEHFISCTWQDENVWGRFHPDEAEPLKIKVPVSNISDKEEAFNLTNHGKLYVQYSDYSKAEKSFSQALKLREQLFKEDPEANKSALAESLYLLGNVYRLTAKVKPADSMLTKSLGYYSQLMKAGADTFLKQSIQVANGLMNLYIRFQEEYKADAYKNGLLDNFPKVEKILADLTNSDIELKMQLFSFYANSSYYLLFVQRFGDAENDAIKSLGLYPSQTWVKTNLSHSLLFQGKYEEALKIYTELKPLLDEEEKSFATICLQDLEELEKSGVVHPDVRKIRGFLRE